MTKLEILRTYRKPVPQKDHPEIQKAYRVLDAWKKMGETILNSSSSFFGKDTLFYMSDKALGGCILFCTEEFIQGTDPSKMLNWDNAKVEDIEEGYITFGNDILSPSFRCILSGTEVEDILNSQSVSDIKDYAVNEDNFVPFLEEFQKTSEVQIRDEDYTRIIKCLGYPFIQEEELEYSRENIINIAVREGLEEYFHWLPKTRCQELQAVSGQVTTVPMPEDSYCVVGLSLQQRGGSLTGDISNPFMYAYEQSLYGGTVGSGLTGSYSGYGIPRTNINGIGNFYDKRALNQAIINYGRRVHWEGPYKDITGSITGVKDTQYIKVSTNTAGQYNIWWGIKSLNFDDVEYAQRTNVINYCSACVKELFATIRAQARREDIPGAVDYSTWLTEAKKEKDEIREVWKKMVKSAGILRGSL